MERPNPKFAIYGGTSECAWTNMLLLPLSEVSKGAVSLVKDYISTVHGKKSRIRETKNLSTDTDSRTNTLLGSFFVRHFWGPLLAATFGVHF